MLREDVITKLSGFTTNDLFTAINIYRFLGNEGITFKEFSSVVSSLLHGEAN